MDSRSSFRTCNICSWLLLAVWMFMGFETMAQTELLRFERFTDEEGLPNNLFREVIQDRDGLFWMAGLDGLTRYDGYEIQSFRHSHIDSTTLSGNNISSIYEDSKRRLWVGIVGGGFNISNSAKTSFRKIKINAYPSESSTLTIEDITEDSSGQIWMASDLGLLIAFEDNDSLVIKSFRQAWSGLAAIESFNNPVTVSTDKNGNVWIGTQTGLFRFDVKSERLFTPDDFKGLPIVPIQNIEYDREGKIWISCQNKGPRLYYTSPESFTFSAFDQIPFRSEGREIHFTFDLDNNLWALVFNEQAYAYDFRDSVLFFQSNVNSEFPQERFFRKPFVDHSGNTWLPVEGFYIYPYQKGFHLYKHPFTFHQSNTCIYGVDQNLYFGYREKGLVVVDQVNGITKHFSKELKQGAYIPADHIADVLKVKSGNLILVGFGNVAVMNPQHRIVYSHNINGTMRAALEDSKGRLWIGGYSGLHLFSEEKGLIKNYLPPGKTKEERQFIQTVLEDARGYIWFASDLKGLCRLDPNTEEIIQFLPIEGDPRSLPSISVLDMVLDANQILWLATDVALVRFDPVTFEMKSYDKSDGVENDFISAIVYARDGMIWMSTHSGISSFNPANERFTNYSTADGLSNVSYYTRSKWYDEQGRLYFGGKNGVDYFDPTQLRNNPTAPRLSFSGITLNTSEKKTIHDLDISKGILQLTHKHKLLEIEFTGLHFAEQEGITYYYKMDGMTKDWIELGDQRKVLFSGLPPGDYFFRVKAMSGDQVWSGQDLVLPVHIQPPFYMTIWFRLMAIVVLLILLYAIIKWRESSIKKKEKMELEVSRKIAELEKRALQAQMNPHFIYNSMNSIQQFMIIGDIEGAMKYLTKFSRILRTVLNISAESRIPLADEIKLIEDYLELENMRFPDKFTYTIHVALDINIHSVDIPPFFIQPQVENAIRHGLLKKTTPGHLQINIMSSDDHLKIIVEDNGIGREAARSAKFQGAVVNQSKGLAIVEERLSHLRSKNGFRPFKITDLYDASNHPAGTRVEITLPLD